MIRINDDVTLDEAELDFVTSRSAGPGGQNVNKVETRVTLRFDVEGSPALTDEHRERLCERLANRINKDGVLSVSAQDHRTQGANREAAFERFVELVREALEVPTPRRTTRVPRGVRQRRLDDKRRRSLIKKSRSGDRFEE